MRLLLGYEHEDSSGDNGLGDLERGITNLWMCLDFERVHACLAMDVLRYHRDMLTYLIDVADFAPQPRINLASNCTWSNGVSRGTEEFETSEVQASSSALRSITNPPPVQMLNAQEVVRKYTEKCINNNHLRKHT